MSTATLPPSRMKPQSRLVTIAEVADLPRTLDGQPVDYELYNGEIVVMAPPAGLHSRHQNRLGRYLSTEAEDAGLGEAFSEAGLILQENPDTLVGFDAAFVLKKSLPVQYHRTGYLLTIPEIVAEIRSKNDWLPEIVSKCEQYLAAGVVEVWILDPRLRTVTTHRKDTTPVIFHAQELLTSELLPGFAVPVEKLFP